MASLLCPTTTPNPHRSSNSSLWNRVSVTIALVTVCALVPVFAAAQAAVGKTGPNITDAPGLGKIPSVSNHYAALPNLYDLDRQPIEQISPLVQRQYVTGAMSTLVKWTVKKGGVFPLHHHSNEQITWITKGRCEVLSQGKRFILTTGSLLVIPPNVPHEFHCTEDTIDIDFFAGARQDWLDGAPSVASLPTTP